MCLHTRVVAFTCMHIPVVMGRHEKTEIERVFVIEAVSPTENISSCREGKILGITMINGPPELNPR